VSELVTILIGLPCSGKSTYLQTIDYDFVISSDAVVEIICRQHKLAYHDYFKLSPNSKLKRQHKTIFAKLVQRSKDFDHVVWDLTNLTKKSRSKIFKLYQDTEFNAVVFDSEGKEELLIERNKRRFKKSGKFIDELVLRDMIFKYERVVVKEPFKNIRTIIMLP
jgi:predicted kinase